MTLSSIFQNKLLHSLRLKAIIQLSKAKWDSVQHEHVSSKCLSFSRNILTPFQAVIKSIFLNNSEFMRSLSTGTGTPVDIQLTSEELYVCLQEFTEEQQLILIGYIDVPSKSVYDSLQQSIIEHNKTSFLDVVSYTCCNFTRLEKILAFMQLSQLKPSELSYHDSNIFKKEIFFEIISALCDTLLMALPVKCSKQAIMKEISPLIHAYKNLRQELDDIEKGKDLPAIEEISGYQEMIADILPCAEHFKPVNITPMELAQFFLYLIAPMLKFLYFVDEFTYRSLIKLYIFVKEDLSLSECEIIEDILKQPPMRDKFDQIMTQVSIDRPISLPQDIFKHKMNTIKGINTSLITTQGVDHYIEFVNELAQFGYIEDTHDTKLAFARDFMGLTLSNDINSPIEKVQWLGLHGNGDNKDFYYLVQYFHDGGCCYKSARNRFKLNDANYASEHNKEGSYARNHSHEIENLLCKYYPKQSK